MAGFDILRWTSTTLTDAQIKALPTTPITLVSAPGSGKRIKVIGAALRVDSTAGAYTNIDATYSAIAVYYLGDFSQWATAGVVDDSTATPSLARRTTLSGGTGIGSADLPPYVDIFTQGWTVPNIVGSGVSENKALAIAADNDGTGNFTGGNAANTLRVDVTYLVL
jgi:hypothetical protein